MADPAATGGTLITVGSSRKYRFDRLLEAVDAVLDQLPRPVTLQHAQDRWAAPRRDGVEQVAMLTHRAFSERLRDARLLICHAGAGTLLEALRHGVPTIAMPRRPELREIADGHQLELAEALGVLRGPRFVDDAASLRRCLGADPPRAVRSSLNLPALLEVVHDAIRRAVAAGAREKIALVATSGGHMSELRQLEPAYREYPKFFVESKPHACEARSDPTYLFPSEDRDWRVARHALAIRRLIARERPGVVLTTGSGSTLPFVLLARAAGARVVYVESLTRVLAPSPTARIASLLADLTVVRWPALRRELPRAVLVPALPSAAAVAGHRDLERHRGIA